jgi:hypothetical protein
MPFNAFSGEWTVMQVPVAQDIELRAVWGSAANDVYAVGTKGTILHYDGSVWSTMSGPTERDLNGIWGRSGNDIFAVGSANDYISHYSIPTIFHYDGTMWNKMSVWSWSSFSSVWGTSGDDLFVAESNDYAGIIHFDGTCWSYSYNPFLYGPIILGSISAIWGSGTDVFAVGSQGILQRTGASWHYMDSSDVKGLYAIWGSAADDIFAVGYQGTILHYNGSTWSTMTNPISKTSFWLNSVWGSSGSDVFAAGGYRDGTDYHRIILHYNGSTWSTMVDSLSGTAHFLNGVWGSSGNDVFAVGMQGTILHYSEGPPATTTTTSGIASTTTTTVSATTTTTIPALPGEWKIESLPQQTNNLFDVWGSGGSDVFAVGDGGRIVHYDGNVWSSMDSGTTTSLLAAWGSSGSDVFAVGFDGTILHYNGNVWSSMDSGAADYVLTDVWGSSANDVFAVGPSVYESGIILHYDGEGWSVMATSWYLTSLWGSAGNDVFAVGTSAPVLHYDGSTWSEITEDDTISFDYLWGTSSTSVYAGYYWGDIAYYDGDCWSAMIGLPLGYSSIWGSSDNDLFAVGEPQGYWNSQGTWIPLGPNVHHFDGNTWSPVETGTLDALNAVWGSSATNVFTVGDNGLILHYMVPEPQLTAPRGGESWQRNAQRRITWNTSCCQGNLKITLRQNSSLVGTIADDVNPAAGFYAWTVGQYAGGMAGPGTGYTIKIEDKVSLLTDESDGTFSIIKLKVNSPNGGENWQLGTTRSITWVAKALTNNLKIVLFKNGVKVGNIVDSIAPGMGSYTWTAGNYIGGTAAAGSGYSIKIKEIGTEAADSSDTAFSLYQ